MTWEIAAAGTVTLDDVTTPAGRRRDQLGGSAVYFALAASPAAPVHVCGVVGRDAEATLRETLGGPGVDLGCLEVSSAPTFRWRAVHDFARWVTADEDAEEGAYAGWTPQLSAAGRRAEVLFLGSMRPDLQRAVAAASAARLVGADTMLVHITAGRRAVEEVAAGADVLFLDRAELAALSGVAPERWAEAAASLCGRGRTRAVVVKAGPLGAACVTAGALIELPAHPVVEVVDPTGAGDSLAGGFLGACAAAGRDDEAFWPQALQAGLQRAAAAVSHFGTAGLRPGAVAARP